MAFFLLVDPGSVCARFLWSAKAHFQPGGSFVGELAGNLLKLQNLHNFSAILSHLESTLTRPLGCVDSKTLTKTLSCLAATLRKNRGRGAHCCWVLCKPISATADQAEYWRQPRSQSLAHFHDAATPEEPGDLCSRYWDCRSPHFIAAPKTELAGIET